MSICKFWRTCPDFKRDSKACNYRQPNRSSSNCVLAVEFQESIKAEGRR